jgi:hypothetical protein
MIKQLATILLSLTMFHDCATNTTNSTVPPRPTPVPVDTDMCSAAEQHLQQMCNSDQTANAYCCAVVAPTKKGKTFTQFCEAKQNEGVFLNPKCVSEVKSCGDIDSCTGSK